MDHHLPCSRLSISHLISTNDNPLPIEAAFIQERLDASTRAIDRLLLQVRELERERGVYKALLSPLRRIPPEILGNIFSFLADHTPRALAQRYLVQACLVCRSWRDGALLTHRLWRNFEFDIVDDARGMQWRCDLAAVWLRRAAMVPKTLAVRGRHEGLCGGRLQCSVASPALAVLLREGPTLRHLSIECGDSMCFRYLLDALNRGHPSQSHAGAQGLPASWFSLPSFRLAFHGTRDEQAGDPPDSLFHHLPPLTSLELELPEWHSRAGWADIELRIPESLLAGLQAFKLKCNWRGPTIMNVLKACQGVETLTLDLGGTSMHSSLPPHTSQKAMLPNLRVFRLRHAPPDSLRIMSVLGMNSLEELDVSMAPPASSVRSSQRHERNSKSWQRKFLPKAYFDALLLNKGHLRKLRIHAAAIQDARSLAIRIIESFPVLTHLTLDDVPISFDAEEYREGEWPQAVLPRLQVLELLQLPFEFSSESIYVFLGFRGRCNRLWNPGEEDSLKRVALSYRSPVKSLEDIVGHRDDDWASIRRRGAEVNVGFVQEPL